MCVCEVFLLTFQESLCKILRVFGCAHLLYCTCPLGRRRRRRQRKIKDQQEGGRSRGTEEAAHRLWMQEHRPEGLQWCWAMGMRGVFFFQLPCFFFFCHFSQADSATFYRSLIDGFATMRQGFEEREKECRGGGSLTSGKNNVWLKKKNKTFWWESDLWTSAKGRRRWQKEGDHALQGQESVKIVLFKVRNLQNYALQSQESVKLCTLESRIHKIMHFRVRNLQNYALQSQEPVKLCTL